MPNLLNTQKNRPRVYFVSGLRQTARFSQKMFTFPAGGGIIDTTCHCISAAPARRFVYFSAQPLNPMNGSVSWDFSRFPHPVFTLFSLANQYTNRRAGAAEMQWHVVSIIPPPAGKVNIFYEKRAVCCAE
ncbi:MAG: hypothetical protein LBD95_05315, partial [Clostridiales Family XIII bacterium]|nr:hypothetical protein [Clostridiales Family XIII bacterium]